MQRMLSVLAFLTCSLTYSQGVKSSCMAPPVKLGDEATLSCHFEEDMSKLQRDVLVYLYKEDREQPVVIYAWHDGHAKIHTMEGYRCDSKLSDYLVIKIANVSESNAGQYTCLSALSKGGSTTCTLRIIGLPTYSSIAAVDKGTNGLLGTEILTFCTVPSVGKGESTNLTCHFSEDMRMTRTTIKIIHYPGTINGLQDFTVLLCQISLNRTMCHTHSDYRFYGNITDKLNLIIPHADERHTGTYLCHVLYTDSGSNMKCMFDLNDYNMKTSPAVSISQVPESLGDNGLKQRTVMIIILASVLGALVVLLVAVIGVMIAYYRKRIQTVLQHTAACNDIVSRPATRIISNNLARI